MPANETQEQWFQRLPFIQSAIRYNGWIAEGRYDAYNFVLTCNGAIATIEAEITKHQDRIDASGNQGPMSPSASPRIYKEGYLAGLREALEVIQMMTAQGKVWSNASETWITGSDRSRE